MNKINKIHLSFPKNENMQVFFTNRGLRGKNILSIANAPFAIEKELKLNDFDTFSIPLFNPKKIDFNLPKLESILNTLFNLVLTRSIDFKFRDEFKKNDIIADISTYKKIESICLFSGGLDSYCGILQAHQYNPNVIGLFCMHSDQARIRHIASELYDGIQMNKDLKHLIKINVPALRTLGYSQMRGFLYFVSAAAWMELLNVDKLIITEVGPTMYQPRIGHFDSVTLTTHPYVLDCAKNTIELLLEKKIYLITPYEDMTKAEIISMCSEKSELKKTHSCISQRLEKPDGTCYGCVMRRLAFIAAGVDDANYERNPINNPHVNSGNLIALLRYSLFILTDYKNMEYFQIENIEMFKKHELFKRFALDNFSAIYKLVESGHQVIEAVKNIYQELKDKLGTQALEKRLNELQKGHFNPNFTLLKQ